MDWFRNGFDAFYRLLLRFYPEDFRDEYGEQMRLDVEERRAREPFGGLLRDILADFFQTAPKVAACFLRQSQCPCSGHSDRDARLSRRSLSFRSSSGCH
jgi:hypothetical protein